MTIFKKIFIISMTFLCLCLIVVCIISTIFFEELVTSFSINTLTKDATSTVYESEVKGDFYFDELKAMGGVKTTEELTKFLENEICKNFIQVLDVNATANTNYSTAFTYTELSNSSLAKNYNGSDAPIMLIKTTPDYPRLATISTVDLSVFGYTDETAMGLKSSLIAMAAPYFSLDGINEEGLTASLHYTVKDSNDTSTTEDTDNVNVIETVMLRIILDHAKNITQAIALFNKYDVFSSTDQNFSFFISDKSGDSVIITYLPDGTHKTLQIYYNDNTDNSEENILVLDTATNEVTNNFQYLTNFILEKDYYSSNTNLNISDYKTIEQTINPYNNTNGEFTSNEAITLLNQINNDAVYSAIYNTTAIQLSYYFKNNENPIVYDVNKIR